MPTCPPYKCTTRMNEYMKKEKKPLSTAGDRFVIHDEENARIRLKKLAKTCKKCELYDVMPMLVNKNGTITWYDDTMNLSFMDDHLHLTKFGRIKVKPLFKRMAQKFTKQFPGLI
ncbi:hypothetical protein WR25_17168 [Diploscapter pachys]|uniref:SGNH domain-containing protein n=1 Tax=Diploscapter pachys TaxID=2018661 RepID=A0A2A2LDE5_9BILA|nr:hypothetical protein WR25_17168 [Diploscapter pachys]